MPLYLCLLSMALALIVLAFNWKVNRNAIFLSLLMILIASMQIRQYLSLYGTDPFWLAIIINNPAPLWSMIGPCLFFYVRSVLTDSFTFRKSDLLHTIPFWVSLAGIMPYLLTPFSYKLEVANLDIKNLDAAYYIRYNWLMNNQWNNLSRSAVQVGYALYCLWMLVRFHRVLKPGTHRSIPKGGLIYIWLVAVSGFVLLAGIYYFTGAYLYYRNPSIAKNFINQYNEVYLFGLVLTCLPSVVLIFPEILYGIPRQREVPARPQPTAPSEPKPVATESAPAMSIADTDTRAPIPEAEAAEETPFHELAQRVLLLMERDKPYLQYDFSIEQLAEKLDVPKHHMYYCFKNILKTKFVQFRAQYRVNEAKRRLLEADHEQKTLYGIGRSCGFSSHTAFYRVFHELVGCSPGEYIGRARSEEGDANES